MKRIAKKRESSAAFDGFASAANLLEHSKYVAIVLDACRNANNCLVKNDCGDSIGG